MSSALTSVLADLGRAFESLGLRWYLFGAQAAIVHGSGRLSADVDVTVELIVGAISLVGDPGTGWRFRASNRPVADAVRAR